MAKIIHLTPFYEPHLGGVETHVRELNRLLIQSDHQVVVICQQHQRDLPLTEVKKGVQILRMPTLDFKSRFLPLEFLQKLYFKLKVWTWMAKQGQLLTSADIVQVHDVFWWIWPLYPLVYYKTFLTFHGWEGRYPVALTAKIQRYYNAMAAKKTLHVGKFIQEFYWDKPSAVTYGGVDVQLLTKPLANLSTSEEPWLSNQTKIVFLGRLEETNELAKTLDFLRLVKEKYPKIKISFVGDGSWRAECEKLGRVTGLVADPSHHLLGADLVCASSYLAMLEAQSLGKVVVAFYSHPLKERYLKTYPGAKWLFIGKEPVAVWEKVDRLTNSQASLVALRSRKFALTQTWEEVLLVYLELWGLLIKN